MRELLKATLGGIYQTLTGHFGIGVAVVAWLQVILQFHLANSHTTAGLIGTVVFAAGLLFVQGAGAIWSFSMFNGDSFSPSSKHMSFGSLTAAAAIGAFVVAGLLAGLVALVLGLFITVTGTLALMGAAAVLAAIQGLVLSGRLWKLASH